MRPNTSGRGFEIRDRATQTFGISMILFTLAITSYTAT